jgi:phospholipid/cholesterol/gamma-HCH transport system substrate-binding protein
VPVGSTLIDLGSLLKSVQPNDVRTLESFLSTAFIGTGPGLRNIIVTGQRLFDALVAAQPETVNLIVDGRTDLRTLQATDGDLATFAKGLASLTGTLSSSNSDIQALIQNGAAAAQQLDPFITSNQDQITALITDLATDSQVTDRYQPQVRALFELLPVVADDLAAIAPNGQVHGLLEFNTSGTVCPYILGSEMPGPTRKVATPVLDNGCSTTAPDMLQRGASSTPAFAAGG